MQNWEWRASSALRSPTPCWHYFTLVFVSQALSCHGTKFHKAYIKQHPHPLCKSKSWQGCHLHLQSTHTSRQTLTWLLGWPSLPAPTSHHPTYKSLVVASKLNLLISPTNSHSTMATSTLIFFSFFQKCCIFSNILFLKKKKNYVKERTKL
jgi:hypothetical protein